MRKLTTERHGISQNNLICGIYYLIVLAGTVARPTRFFGLADKK